MRRQCAVVGMIVLAAAVGGRAEFQVNTYVQHNQIGAAVAMNDVGNFVVVWRSHIADGRGGGVFGRCFAADGTPVGDEFRVNMSTVDVGGWRPAVAMDPSGGFVVVWIAARAGGTYAVARMFDAQGTALTDELSVSNAPNAVESTPSVAMGPDGMFVVAWNSWYDHGLLGKSYVSGRIFEPHGFAVTDVFLVDDATQANWPDVAMDGSGGFVITWIRMGDTYNRPYGEYIMYRRYRSDGMAAGPAVQVTGDLNSRWYGPSVASAPDGGFVLTWAVGPFPYDICAQSFDSMGVPIAEPYLVNAGGLGNQGRPRVASAGGREYLIVWDSNVLDGTGCCVRCRLCTVDGEFIGDELTVTAEGQGLRWYPDAAMAADGRYVVVWVSEGQDGSGYDIFAKLGPQ